MVQAVQSGPPTLQAIQSHITGVELSRPTELREPLKPPGNWQRFLCALYTRGFDVGERGAKAFEAVASFNGKVLERKQMLEGVRSHLARLERHEDLKSSKNIDGILKTNNFWQALGTATRNAIEGEREQLASQARKALGMAHSQGAIVEFLATDAPDSRRRDWNPVFLHNFTEACKQTYPQAYESGSLSRAELQAVLEQVNDASLG